MLKRSATEASQSLAYPADYEQEKIVAKMNFGPYSFESSREDKVLFPNQEITKGDMVEYYMKISEFMLPRLKDRPLTLHRFPDGIGEEGFIQQKADDYFLDWVSTVAVPKEDGKITHALVDKRASLAYLADQAVIAFHTRLSRQDRIKTPDLDSFMMPPFPEVSRTPSRPEP